MNVEFTTDTAEIDSEIEALEALKANVTRGWMEVGRDESNRLVFRMTASGKAKVEHMGGEE